MTFGHRLYSFPYGISLGYPVDFQELPCKGKPDLHILYQIHISKERRSRSLLKTDEYTRYISGVVASTWPTRTVYSGGNILTFGRKILLPSSGTLLFSRC